MDPRRPDYNVGGTDPRKRNASQSPDGAQPRKQQRQDNIRDNGPATNHNDSRRSSVSSGTPATRASNPGAPSPRSRTPSMQVPTGPRKPSDAPAFSSPRSPYEGTVGGRSATDDKASSVDPDSLMDLLTKFSSDVAGRAAIEHEKRKAEAQYLSAQREFNEMQKHFISFPPIKERKSSDRDAARDAFKAKEKLLLEHTSTQQSTVEMLASLLGKLVTPKPNPDVASRAEYKSLQKDFLGLKEEFMSLKQLRGDLTAVRRTVDQVKLESGQVPRFHGDIEQLKKDTTVLKSDTTMLWNWKHQTDTRIKDFDKFDQRLNNIGAASTTAKKELDDFKTKGVSTLVTKQQINGLEKQVVELEKQVSDVQKQSTERATSYDILSHNVANLQKAQAKTAADNLNLLAPAKNQALNSESKERLANLTKEQTELKEQVETLQKSGTDIFNSVESKIDNAVAEQKNMKSTIHQLGQDIVNFKEKFNMIQETEKTIQQPESALGKAADGMASTTFMETRLNNIRKDLDALVAQQDEKDTMVFDAIDKVEKGANAQLGNLENSLNKQLGKVEDSLSQLGKVGESFKAQLQGDRNHAQQNTNVLQKITEGCQDLQTSVNKLQEAMQSKASTESVESFKNELSMLSTEFKKLQVHHQRTKSTSQAPPPAANAPQQFSPQPQQMANGGTGSPQVNGGHFSFYASPYPPGHGSVQLPPTPEMQNIQIQINGLVGVTQQLKMRCDNLTSEDIVRAMVDQFGTMYPEARNFNSSVQNLRNGLNSVQQQLALLQQHKAQPVEQFKEDVKNAATKAEGASATAHTVFQEVQKHWGEINAIKQNIKTLETNIAKVKTNHDSKLSSPQRDAASDGGIHAEVTSLRNELDQATNIASDASKIASAADSLSKQHSSRFSKLQPEKTLAALEKKVAALDTTVQDHTRTLGDGEPALKTLQESAAQAKVEFESVKKNMGALKGRIELLEQGV